MNNANSQGGHGFGTAPVFLAGISTILGAILFLRFGYAVANIGLTGSLLLILLGHAITIPTGLAIAEIATNLKVKGGGEYYIVSRSFGSSIGGAIGIALAISQTISVAFYMIAFAEAFTPLFPYIEAQTGITPHVRMISLPAAAILIVFVLSKGASLGVKMLWIVSGILTVSLVLFFMGGGEPSQAAENINLDKRVSGHDSFFEVFAICFPGFTGMTAGVGLSGDLRKPGRAIPLGTMAATLTGMLVYVMVVVKLYFNATPAEMAEDQLIMSKIAIWGPAIPIGLAAACLSSAIGSILIAPRTLQALGSDRILPTSYLNRKLSTGRGKANEPLNATLLVAAIALIFMALGDVDFVAQLISVFFMTTYGSLCMISFLEHFSGDPSYRPTFRSRWYISLVGAVLCFLVMFQMQPLYALLALALLYLIYRAVKHSHKDQNDLSTIFQNAIFQLTRKMRLKIQTTHKENLTASSWRPSIIAISDQVHERLSIFSFLSWMSHYYGFGSFFHYIHGYLNSENVERSKSTKQDLLKLVTATRSSIFVNTVVSPSFTSAIAQVIQISGLSGLENNSLLLEFHKKHHQELKSVLIGCRMAEVVKFNALVLRSSEHNFGYHTSIDVWLTKADVRNANLMILLAFILKGHTDWKRAHLRIYLAQEASDQENQTELLNKLLEEGRIPIGRQNVIPVPYDDSFEDLVNEQSKNSDLVILGFQPEDVHNEEYSAFKRYTAIRSMLFVNAKENIRIN